VKQLEPGWQQKRMDNFNVLVSGGFQSEDLVNDGWTDIIRNLLFIAQQEENKDLSPEKLSEIAELADFKKMEQVRSRVDDVVQDPATAEALKPWYRQFCKRPCFHDEYLQAFNRPNVTLVDTHGRGVEKITETGVVANGELYEVDCLVYATGFEVGTSYTRRSGYELYGKGGRSLTEAWDDGVRTLHGLCVHGFPNVFIMGGAQAGFTANYPHLLDEQSRHIAWLLDEAEKRQVQALEPSVEGEAAWVDKINEKAVLRTKFLEECTPGYYNNEGKPQERSGQNAPYGGGSVEYFEILDKWRADGNLDGLELR
jgi:cyclohexanone monooxygenase